MLYVFKNWNETKIAKINSQDYPDAYLFINLGGDLCFELLDRADLEHGIFQYRYNDYTVSIEADVVTVWSMMAHFDSFVEEIQDYFQNK